MQGLTEVLTKKERNKQWAINNPEKNKESKAKWACNNREKRNEYIKEWKKRNPEKCKNHNLKNRNEYHKQWKRDHPEECRKSRKTFNMEHPEKYKEYRDRFNAKYPGVICEKNHYYHTESRYGVTKQGYNEMFELQNGRCVTCGCHQTEFKRRLAIDHDHKTGRVRGLLCTKCNLALGAVNDSIVILSNMIEYLKESNRKEEEWQELQR